MDQSVQDGVGSGRISDPFVQLRVGTWLVTTVLVTGLRGTAGWKLHVIANCIGGVKEVLCFDTVPDRYALWHARCPDNPEFAGELEAVLAEVRTVHWFDPCALLERDARSELKPECRRRMRGGGFEPVG